MDIGLREEGKDEVGATKLGLGLERDCLEQGQGSDLGVYGPVSYALRY